MALRRLNDLLDVIPPDFSARYGQFLHQSKSWFQILVSLHKHHPYYLIAVMNEHPDHFSPKSTDDIVHEYIGTHVQTARIRMKCLDPSMFVLPAVSQLL